MIRLVWLLLLPVIAGCLPAQNIWKIAEVNGRQIRYQIIDGNAVYQGDILLGPAAAFEAALESKSAYPSASVIAGQGYRWTDNTIPYVIDEDLPQKERVTNAMAAWSGSTPIRFTARTNQQNYVRFRSQSSGCNSHVGMIGGVQYVNLSTACGPGETIHEIGHTIGLWHTQSRQDRNMFLKVDNGAIPPPLRDQSTARISDGVDVGAYPYDSIMEYAPLASSYNGTIAFETIPGGIPMGQRTGLVPADIDVVRRLYGEIPRQTVVASNPPGLTVVVDGASVTTPATFDWAEGSTHTLNIADQPASNSDYRFGRWSDFGQRSHTITASPATTVYTAHMRQFVHLTLAADAGGTLSVNPASEGNVYPNNTLIELTAQPASGNTFYFWELDRGWSYYGDINPLRIPVDPSLGYTAHFTNRPVTIITSSPTGMAVTVDGDPYTTPAPFDADTWEAGSKHTIRIAATQAINTGATYHECSNWSDGGALEHEITATGDNTTITANCTNSYRVTVASTTGGTISLNPSPVNGYLPAGSNVELIATPSGGYQFTGWSGSTTGTEARKTIAVNGELDISGSFARPRTLTAAGTVNGASFISGPVAPGEIVTLFGLGIGPDTLTGVTLVDNRISTTSGGVSVLFDGVPAPMIYASTYQVAAIVPFSVAGRSTTVAQLRYNGQVTNTLTLPVAQTAPAFFSYNSSGLGGGAFLNENGTVNTPENAAARGSIAVLYATGLGAMTPAVEDGALALGPEYPKPVAPLKVFIADRECEVLYGGAAPGYVAGLIQLNVRIPSDIEAGNVPVVLQVGGATSPRTVSLAVR